LEEIDRLTKEKEERDRLSEKERKKNDKKKLEELERAKQEEITKNLQLEKERLQAQLSEKAVASTKKDEYIKTHPDIHSWLNELGLAEYLAVFITNGYDTMEMFSILNDDDLETCQITLTGHRKKILHASNLLSAELNKKNTPKSTVPQVVQKKTSEVSTKSSNLSIIEDEEEKKPTTTTPKKNHKQFYRHRFTKFCRTKERNSKRNSKNSC